MNDCHTRLAHHSSLGMSLLEVMIALSVLAVGIMGALGSLASVNNFRRETDERALAYAAATEYAQKVRQNLGGPALLPWQHQRRATAIPGMSPPSLLPISQADLLSFGVLNGPTGLDDPQFYLEYYSDALATYLGNLANSGGDPHQLWLRIVGLPSANIPPDTSLALNPSPYMSNDKDVLLGQMQSNPLPLSIFIRVVVSWRPSGNPGGVRLWAESFISYRP